MKRRTISAFRTYRHLTLAAVLVGASMVPASADVFNGTFAGTVAGPAAPFYQTVQKTDSTTIPGWTVTSGATDSYGGSVDWIGSYWKAPGNTQSVDLDGSTPGGVQQTISTVVGNGYKLNFELSQNPDGGPAINTLNIITGTTITPFAITGHNAYLTATGYESVTIPFTATGATTLIGFMSSDQPNDSYGAVVADVNVTPEPRFLAVLGIGLLALSVFGYRARKA